MPRRLRNLNSNPPRRHLSVSWRGSKMSSWVTIGFEFFKTLAGPSKGRSRPETDNSTAGGGLTSGADVRPESQTSIKTEDSPNQQELEGLASGAESIVVRPESQTSI